MGALDIFTPQGKYAGERPAFVPKDFSDVAGAAFTNTRQNFNTDAEIRLIGDPLNERNSMVKTRLGRDVFELTGMNEKYPNPSPEGQAQKLEEANKDIDELIMRGRKEFPTIYEGIKTTAEIVEEGKGVAQQATINYEDVASRNLSDVSRIAGSLTGGIGGAFTDPINILTLPLGAGAVKPIGAGALGYAKGVVMQAGKEGFIQAGIEAASIPQIAKWQNEVGHTYGLGEAATDVAFGFLGGAGIRGGAEAIVPSLRGLRRGGAKVSSYVLDRIASKSPDMPQTVKDSLKYMSRTAYIDEDAPTPIRARDELQSHREAFEKVSSDVEKYDVPTVATKAGEPPLADTRVDIEKLDMSDPFTIQAVDILSQLQSYKSFDINNPRDVKTVIGYTPESLTQFIKKNGGIADNGGDLASAGINYKRLPGLIRKSEDNSTGSIFGGGAVAADKNSSIDYVKERAFDAGYFPEKSGYQDISNDELMDAIRADLEGKKIYTADDLERIAIHREGSDLVDMYDRVGITADMPPKDVANQLRDMAAENEIPFDGNAYALREYREDVPEPPIEVKPTDRAQQMRANFDTVLKEDPNMIVTLEDGSNVKLSDYADMVKENENVIEALTTCRLS